MSSGRCKLNEKALSSGRKVPFQVKNVIIMQKAMEQPNKHAFPSDDDLLGKNRSRRKNGGADQDPFADTQPQRKRTEDLGDSL